MLNAKDAAELAITSDNHIKGCCERICIKIEERAKNGGRDLILDQTFAYTPEFKIEKPPYGPVDYTNDKQRRIKSELEKLGYIVKIIEVKHSGQGGLGCMDDDPQPFSTWHIKISW